MPGPEPAAQLQLISGARAEAAELVRTFTAECSSRETVNATCARAAATLDRYCSNLLTLMVATLPPVTPADVAWMRSQYLTLIVEFGSAIRDAIQDSETRHAAAQGIQFSVLEHERHLRPALEAAALAHAPVVDIGSPKAPEPAVPAPAIPSETV
jgi:hypothetical protein